MIRKIIRIDEEKCNGCSLCAGACHEGAIEMKDGKARLIRDDYCDGLGDCLPVCPTGAITFETREAAAYDAKAVQERQKEPEAHQEKLVCGCPGLASCRLERTAEPEAAAGNGSGACRSRLMQWPVQLQLAPVNAPYFQGARLLIAADCTAFAYGGFHEEFIKDKITLIGCPKLDSTEYSEKLTEIIRGNDIKSVTIVRMEVPCCKSLEHAVVNALKNSGKFIPWQTTVISTDGRVLER